MACCTWAATAIPPVAASTAALIRFLMCNDTHLPRVRMQYKINRQFKPPAAAVHCFLADHAKTPVESGQGMALAPCIRS